MAFHPETMLLLATIRQLRDPLSVHAARFHSGSVDLATYGELQRIARQVKTSKLLLPVLAGAVLSWNPALLSDADGAWPVFVDAHHDRLQHALRGLPGSVDVDRFTRSSVYGLQVIHTHAMVWVRRQWDEQMLDRTLVLSVWALGLQHRVQPPPP